MGKYWNCPKEICSSLAAIHFVKVAPKKLICFEVLKIQYIHISWGTRCLDILKLCQSPFSVHFSPKRQMCLQFEIFHGRFGKIRNIKSNVPLIETIDAVHCANNIDILVTERNLFYQEKDLAMQWIFRRSEHATVFIFDRFSIVQTEISEMSIFWRASYNRHPIYQQHIEWE